MARDLRRSAPSGEAILAERARFRVVSGLVCVNAPALFAATAAPVAVAAFEGANDLTLALAPGAVVAAVLAVIGRLRAPDDPRRSEALVSVAASFILAALLTTPGFVALGMPWVDAVFEATSGVTTTGLSLATNAEDWPYAGHFLRAWLQWIGGFAFVAAALALVVGQGVVAKRLGVAGGVGDDRAASTGARARRLLIVYIALSVAVVLAVAALHPDPALGALVGLAAISTGGFSPVADSVASAGVAAQAATIAGCLVGAVSLGLWWIAIREGPFKALSDGELRLFAIICALGVAAVIALEAAAGGAGAWEAAFTALSAQTTAGFSVGDVSAFAPTSLIALIMCMLVGGCLGATAGGVKAFRIGFIAAAARLALLRARTPSSARTYLRVFGRKTEPEEGTDVIALLAVYALTTAGLWLALSLSGAAPLAGLFDVVSALSTVGLS
ncbi:MAG: potassium transporter TrkG, partial [Pseudomonadota bacterium]